MKIACPLPTLLLLAATLAWPLAASAQWQWLDSTGHKVFSDRPPPPDIPEKNILKQPKPIGGPAIAATPSETPETSASAAPKPPQSSGVDKDLEEKKKQAEAAEAAKKKAEEEKNAKARIDNCARARQSKATLDSGMRIAHVDAKGERVYLDDSARAVESARVQGIINSDCAQK
ncbi:MAG TPA: DUF4124 domain-containing protein [Burkholderiaceae bacterium]